MIYYTLGTTGYHICNGLYSHLQRFIISAMFCHKSHSRKSNGIPCWSELHHIQKWKKYCRFLVHSSGYVCSKDTNRPKYIPYWLWPWVFSIDVLLSQKSKINNPIRKVIHFRAPTQVLAISCYLQLKIGNLIKVGCL